MSRRTKPVPILERDFQANVTRVLDLFGWRWYHTFDSRRSVAGFPDVVAVRRGRVLFLELKGERTRVDRAQFGWAADLLQAAEVNDHVEYHLWRPSDWETLMAVLR